MEKRIPHVGEAQGMSTRIGERACGRAARWWSRACGEDGAVSTTTAGQTVQGSGAAGSEHADDCQVCRPHQQAPARQHAPSPTPGGPRDSPGGDCPPAPGGRECAISWVRAIRAVQITRFGGPEVLDIVDVPEPTPGPGQQLYDVSNAGINYADTHHSLT